MKKSRNGLLEIYRFILCFWPMYHHEFFFFARTSAFSIAQLTVDFFFIISGYFLISSMQKVREEKLLVGVGKLLHSRLKPIWFSLAFIALFNFLCLILFIREDYFYNMIWNVRYWWFILYLLIGITFYYLMFRAINHKIACAVFLVFWALEMAVIHYLVGVKGYLLSDFLYFTRMFGCLALGILCSYIPKWKPKGFNYNIIFVVVLVPVLLQLAYGQKDYWICIGMLFLFCALVYFSSNINVGGKFFDVVGQLSTRLYIYMGFLSMLSALGLTHHRLLFIIDVFLAVLDLLFCTYYKKYKNLNKLLRK